VLVEGDRIRSVEPALAAGDTRNAPARLKRLKSHPWAGIDKVRQSLPE